MVLMSLDVVTTTTTTTRNGNLLFLQLLGELMAMDPAPSKGNGFLYSRFLVLMTAGMSYWIFATYFTWDMVWT